MQTHYCHSSTLGAKVKIETVSTKHYTKVTNLKANQAGEKVMNPYTLKDLGTADLMVYMAYDKDQTGASGIAAGGVVCTTGAANIKEKQSITEWQKNFALFAWVTSLLVYIRVTPHHSDFLYPSQYYLTIFGVLGAYYM